MGIDPGTNVLGYGVLRVMDGSVSMLAMGVIDMHRCADATLKLGRIYERVSGLIRSYHPAEMAIEAPFFGKNVQSMLKLGRAQGVAIAAAIGQNVPVSEYAPMQIKLAVTGSGSSGKEQVAAMLRRVLCIKEDNPVPYLDATDALAAAYCHYLESRKPTRLRSGGPRSWSEYVRQHSPHSMPAKTERSKHLMALLSKK